MKAKLMTEDSLLFPPITDEELADERARAAAVVAILGAGWSVEVWRERDMFGCDRMHGAFAHVGAPGMMRSQLPYLPPIEDPANMATAILAAHERLDDAS